MVFIRAVKLDDLEPLYELAAQAGVGLTTLPKDMDLLRRRILKSQRSLENIADRPGDESYLWVMEDAATKQIVGASGMASKVGGFEPFYAYRIELEVHESELLKVHTEVQVLHLVRDHNGPCEIGSLFLAPAYRGKDHGKLLQLIRFIFMAEHPEAFEPLVVSEMRGMIDEQGHSPFWDAVGRHFFAIDFPRADHLSVVNKKFIADLMPRHPLYVPLLPAAAQAVIGKVHDQGKAALRNLESEGFSFGGMVDIFDAGAVVSCPRDRIRTVRQSRRIMVTEITAEDSAAPTFLIGTTGNDFRGCTGALEMRGDGVVIGAGCAEVLRVKVGDALRVAPLRE